MLSVAIALILIIGSINIVNFQNVLYSAEIRLDMLENGNGKIPTTGIFGNSRNPLSPEAPFDSRYFSVYMNLDGTVIYADTDNIAAIDKNSASSMAQRLWSKGKTGGITGNYAFRLLPLDNAAVYVFLDHSRELDTFYSFLTASVLICIFAFILVFVLIVIFSKAAIKPVAESYEKQKRFITDAGHELKTPLTVIRAANEVIELEYGESRWTSSINNQVTRLSELTNKLVILSRMSEDKGINYSKFSLSDTLRECISYFEAVEYSKDKEIRTDIEENIEYNGDEKAIAQLFTLLTDNAMKYSPEGSVVDISMKKTAKNIEIVFLNSAENVTQGNLDILFERFYRPDKARNSGQGGHGIGLSVAKAIVDAHKGKINAKSPDGKSFKITVFLY